MSSQGGPLIARLQSRFEAELGLTPVVAGELEFYLHGSTETALDAWLYEVRSTCTTQGVCFLKFEPERGQGQFEIALAPLADAARAATEICLLKDIITQTATTHNMRADFAAKPLEGEPASGLHIHLHLADSTSQNLFTKQDEQMSAPLAHSLAGLLAWLPECMPVFAPTEASYLRFGTGGNTPSTISWGANNRTVALRLPDKPHFNKHIEHRVAGADADAQLVVAVLLAAMHDGISAELSLTAPQIYGDAALAQYGLATLPKNLEEARRAMQGSTRVARYFNVQDLWPAS